MATVALNLLHHLFAQPLALALLAALPLLAVLALLAWRRRRRALAWLGNTPALKTLIAEQAVLRRLRGLCLVLGLLLLTAGVAGPQWGRDWDQPSAPGRDLVVVLDLSRSMLAEMPSRQQRARTSLVDLSNTIQRHGGHRLGLVVFAGHARVLCPLTHDYDHFRDALDQLDARDPPPDLEPGSDSVSGTRIGEALRLAVATHDPEFRGAQDILLLSDGDDPAHDDEWRAGIEAAQEAHIPVHTIGIGDPERASPIPYGDGYQRYQGEIVSTRLQEKPLQEIARLTKGTYTPAGTHALALGQLFRERIEPQGAREDSGDTLPVYRQRYSWLLGPAFFFLAAELALGLRGRLTRRRTAFGPTGAAGSLGLVRAPVLALSFLGFALLGAAPAPGPEDLLRQGNAAFDRKDYATAVDLYTRAEDGSTDPGFVAFNKASALYQLAGAPENASGRQGLYREAELHYQRCLEDASGLRRARALYGLGNSLLQQDPGRGTATLEAAVRAYKECLTQAEVTPELALDARHNLELAKLLLLQARTAPDKEGSKPKEDEGDTPKDNSSKPDDRQLGPSDQGTGGADSTGEKVRTQVQPGEQPIRTEERPAPGAGGLPPVPDTDELVPMAPEDAAAHLERAVAQVLRERREHQQHSAHPPASSVKDW